MTEPKVYRAKISDLKTLGEKNPNKGTERGVYAVEKSLEKFGAWRSIAVAQDGQVVAGNHTLEAYAAAGNEDVLVVETDGQQLIVVKRTDIAGDDPKAKEYAIADNRSSELGLDWNTEAIQALVDQDINLSDWFQQDELAELLAGLDGGIAGGDDPGADIDRAGELQQKWQTARGQVWEVPSLSLPNKKHYLTCNDSLQKYYIPFTDYVLFCDPFFGENVIEKIYEFYQCRHSVFITGGKQLKDVLLRVEKFHEGVLLHTASIPQMGNIHKLFYEHKIVIWTSNNNLNFGLDFSSVITPEMSSERLIGDIYHHTTKPVDVCKKLIAPFRQTAVVDTFAGAGSSLVAAEQLQKEWFGIEIDPGFVAMTLERVSLMGMSPVLEGSVD